MSSGDCEGCITPSCVLFGFDFTLLECYGDDWENKGTDTEHRTKIAAVEGVHYKIDKVRMSVDSHVQTFEDGKFNFDDIFELIKLINMKETCTLNFDIEYTALTELHSATFSSSFTYSDLAEMIVNFTPGFQLTKGNTAQTMLKSRNIQPGKHIISVSIDLNMYETLALKNISNPVFEAYAYEEVE